MHQGRGDQAGGAQVLRALMPFDQFRDRGDGRDAQGRVATERSYKTFGLSPTRENQARLW